jgi:hypothetical protein
MSKWLGRGKCLSGLTLQLVQHLLSGRAQLAKQRSTRSAVSVHRMPHTCTGAGLQTKRTLSGLCQSIDAPPASVAGPCPASSAKNDSISVASPRGHHANQSVLGLVWESSSAVRHSETAVAQPIEAITREVPLGRNRSVAAWQRISPSELDRRHLHTEDIAAFGIFCCTVAHTRGSTR